MRFHRPVVRREAVLLPSDPLEPLQTIRYAVRAAIADVFGATGVPENADGYRPYLSLAYSNTAQPAASAVAAVDGVTAAPADLTVDAVSLIEMHRDNRMYEWRTSRPCRSAGCSLGAAESEGTRVGFFGSYVYADHAWSEVDPDAEAGVPSEPYMVVMIHDSDIAVIRYTPAGVGTGEAFLGYAPRAYFGDPAAPAAADTAIEAAGLAAWAELVGTSPAPDEIERFLASDDKQPDDRQDDVPDEDVFVELKTARFLQTLGLPPLPR